MAKNSSVYYNNFIEIAECAHEASKLLLAVFSDYNSENMKSTKDSIHLIESKADVAKHIILESVAKDFITPIDRRDIIKLAEELDNVVDKIDHVLITTYIYDILKAPIETIKFAEIISKSCENLLELMKEFSNFKKSDAIKSLVIKINDIEGEGDGIYIETSREIHMGQLDNAKVIGWMKLLDTLEECCDACEHVANVTELVVMSNS